MYAILLIKEYLGMGGDCPPDYFPDTLPERWKK